MSRPRKINPDEIYAMYVEGLDYKEIAEALDISIMSVLDVVMQESKTPEGKPPDHIAHLNLSTQVFRALEKVGINEYKTSSFS